MIQETIDYKRSHQTSSEVIWNEVANVKDLNDVTSLIFTGCKSIKQMEEIINNYVVSMTKLEVIDLRDSCIDSEIANMLFNIKINGVKLGKKVFSVFDDEEERSKYSQYLRTENNDLTVKELIELDVEYYKHMKFNIIDTSVDVELLVKMCEKFKQYGIDSRNIDNIIISNMNNNQILEVMNKYNIIRSFNSFDDFFEACKDDIYKLRLTICPEDSNDVTRFITDICNKCAQTEGDIDRLMKYLLDCFNLDVLYIFSHVLKNNIVFKKLFSLFKTNAKRLYIRNMNLGCIALPVVNGLNIGFDFLSDLLELRISNSYVTFDTTKISKRTSISMFPLNDLQVLEMKNVVFNNFNNDFVLSFILPSSIKRIVFDNCILRKPLILKNLQNTKIVIIFKDLSLTRERMNKIEFYSCSNISLFSVNAYLDIKLCKSDMKLNVTSCVLSLLMEEKSKILMSGSLEKLMQLYITESICKVENINNTKIEVLDLLISDCPLDVEIDSILHYIYLSKMSKLGMGSVPNLLSLYKIFNEKKKLKNDINNEVYEFEKLDLFMSIDNITIWDILSVTSWVNSSLRPINNTIMVSKELKLYHIPIASMEPVSSVVGPDCEVTFVSIDTVGCWFLRSLHRLVAKSLVIGSEYDVMNILYDYHLLPRSKCQRLDLPNVNHEVVMQILPKSPFSSIYNRGVNLTEQFARASDRRMRLNNPLYESFSLDVDEDMLDEDMLDEDMLDEDMLDEDMLG